MGAITSIHYSTDNRKPDMDNPPREWVIANARLVIAAPNLLAALKGFEYPNFPGRFCDHADFATELCPRCKAARAAIAQAEGIANG